MSHPSRDYWCRFIAYNSLSLIPYEQYRHYGCTIILSITCRSRRKHMVKVHYYKTHRFQFLLIALRYPPHFDCLEISSIHRQFAAKKFKLKILPPMLGLEQDQLGK